MAVAAGFLLVGALVLAVAALGSKAASAVTSSTTGTGVPSPAAGATATPGTVPVAPAGGFTRQTWAAALLAALGRPVTSQAISNIVAWETQEGGAGPQFGVSGNTASFNPINTSQDAAGASTINSDGVKAYTSWTQGLQATVQTLNNGLYPAILGALDRPQSEFEAAVNGSPWGTVF